MDEIRRLREIIEDLERSAAESTRTTRRLSVRDAVTRALSESQTLAAAAPRVVQSICETFGWDAGAVWVLEPHLALLRCVAIWHAPSLDIPKFETATRRSYFPRGAGLPGTVWDTAKPTFVADVPSAGTCPRAIAASQEGLRAALAFPIAVGGTVLGVLEFFSDEIPEPDTDLVDILGALGSQIGQFIERKHAEDMLDQYFTLSVDMLCVAGYDGYFKWLNPAWERTLGYTIDELKARPFIEFVHPDDRNRTGAELTKISKGHLTVYFENRYRAKDGSYRWLQWNSAPFAERQLVYAAARDVTEQKRAEDSIHRLREAAESANRAKSEFLARMSHEIRTPLNVIIGTGDLLERSPLNPEQRQYVRVFQRAGANLLALINDILDLAKVESGRITLEHADFDLSELLDATVETMSLRAQEKALDLTYEIAPGTPRRLIGDPDRLRQVLINLVGNAVKFTGEGGVLIRVEPDAERQIEGALRFSVLDTGAGIPPEKLESIFEAFTQADASTTRKHGGTGLGLAISRRLVDLMDGRIWAENRDGGGAVLRFTVHCGVRAGEESGPAADGGEPRTPAAPVTGLRILVAEDSEDNQFLVTEYLKNQGHTLDFANNGVEAFEKFRSSRHDIVLMDLQMPEMDGYQATREIRKWEREQSRAATPIIALSASALDAELQGALDAGCTAYVRKPVRMQTLLDTLRQFAGRTLSAAQPGARIRVTPDSRLRAAVPGYLESRREDVRSIRSALERSDYEAIRGLGHKMSGTGTGYGFPPISEIGQAIERAAREHDPAQVAARASELAAYLDRVELS